MAKKPFEVIPSAKDISSLVEEDFFDRDAAAARLTPQQRRQAGLLETAPITSPAQTLGMVGPSSIFNPPLPERPKFADVPANIKALLGSMGAMASKDGSELPRKPTIFPTGPRPLSSLSQAKSRASWLEKVRESRALEGKTLTEEEKDQLAEAYKYMDDIAAADARSQFSNQMMQTLLPQIFSQASQKSEADREYARDLARYQAEQRILEEKRNRATRDRKSMFALLPSLFPNLDLDLSEFGGEMDPGLLPTLIQMAQLRSRERQKTAQPVGSPVARPIVRYT